MPRHPRNQHRSLGPFKKGVGYEGFGKSLYGQDWFDSSPERNLANIVDDADEITMWVRLQRNDLPILWSNAGNEYNPDLVVVERDGKHLVVEVKMDKEMASADVLGKREAAQRWANHVNADPHLDAQWGYLLVSESDVKACKGSWTALKGLGQ